MDEEKTRNQKNISLGDMTSDKKFIVIALVVASLAIIIGAIATTVAYLVGYSLNLLIN